MPLSHHSNTSQSGLGGTAAVGGVGNEVGGGIAIAGVGTSPDTAPPAIGGAAQSLGGKGSALASTDAGLDAHRWHMVGK